MICLQNRFITQVFHRHKAAVIGRQRIHDQRLDCMIARPRDQKNALSSKVGDWIDLTRARSLARCLDREGYVGCIRPGADCKPPETPCTLQDGIVPHHARAKRALQVRLLSFSRLRAGIRPACNYPGALDDGGVGHMHLYCHVAARGDAGRGDLIWIYVFRWKLYRSGQSKRAKKHAASPYHGFHH
ncbi:hypothetical protein D3C72_1068840 [compost metagenome]